jgi:surfactin synthase thioesterase subunit
MPPGAEQRAWAERLVAACERGIAELAGRDSPFQKHLLADLIELRDRLRAELLQGPPI